MLETDHRCDDMLETDHRCDDMLETDHSLKNTILLQNREQKTHRAEKDRKNKPSVKKCDTKMHLLLRMN